MLRQTLFAARWIWSRNFASLTFSFWICCRSSSETRYARSFSCGSGGDDIPVRPSMMHAIVRFGHGPTNRVARPRAHARCRQRGRAPARCRQRGRAPARCRQRARAPARSSSKTRTGTSTAVRVKLRCPHDRRLRRRSLSPLRAPLGPRGRLLRSPGGDRRDGGRPQWVRKIHAPEDARDRDPARSRNRPHPRAALAGRARRGPRDDRAPRSLHAPLRASHGAREPRHRGPVPREEPVARSSSRPARGGRSRRPRGRPHRDLLGRHAQAARARPGAAAGSEGRAPRRAVRRSRPAGIPARRRDPRTAPRERRHRADGDAPPPSRPGPLLAGPGPRERAPRLFRRGVRDAGCRRQHRRVRGGSVNGVLAALRKDLLLTWRGRLQIVAVFAFGAAALLLFSFAIGPDSSALRQHAAGFLWLAMLLASTLSLAESFERELEERALTGLLLLPVSAAVLYYGKAIANLIQLALVGVLLVPVMVILYDAGTLRLLPLLGVIVLGAAGLSAPGTLYAAMTAQARARQALLPLLLFPLVVPVLLAAVKATSLLVLGDPMGQIRPWATLLAAFAVIHLSLCGLLFGRVVDEG